MWHFFKTLLISLLVILLLGPGFAWRLIRDGDWIRGTDRHRNHRPGRIGGLPLSLDDRIGPGGFHRFCLSL